MALVDGAPGAAIPLDDRGLAYGDGVFETVAVVDGAPALWSRHYDRLARGCRVLGFEPPGRSLLEADIASLTADDGAAGIVKIVVTRGSGGRGYRAPARPQPRRLVSRFPLPAYPVEWWRRGVTLRICETELPYRPALRGSKHLNRLEQVLARGEWDDPDIAEGLMATPDGHLGEGTMSNLFARIGDELVTPPIADYGVAGVVRGWLLDEGAVGGCPVLERRLSLTDLAGAGELFVTNSVIGLWPVRRIEGHGEWRDWPVARALLSRLCRERLVAGWLGL